jgi:hypothetical protein
MKQENKILLHTIKHNPRDGEVYITWEGETFRGNIQDIEVRRAVDAVTTFTISGFVDE